MSTPSNTMPESFEAPRAGSPISSLQPFLWAVRREVWEYRSIYLAPLAVAVVFLLAFVLRTIGMRVGGHAVDPTKLRESFENYFMMASGLMMLTSMVVGAFYCLDALHGERRDRSILFWKSMPVSDVTTVLAKAAVPVVVLQLIAWAGTVGMWLTMMAVSDVAWLGSGMSAATLWSQLPFFQLTFLLLYHLAILHGLWHAPFYAWVLMVSAWARRAPFLWAVLPPLAFAFVERAPFSVRLIGTPFTDMLLYHLAGSPNIAPQEHGLMGMLGHFEPWNLLTSPGLWTGLAFFALCLAAAVRLRRYRDAN